MNSISKIDRFVALTNVLSFLISKRGVIMEYPRFKRVYEEYESLSIPSIIEEIEGAAPDFNALQGYFDFAKCKLNDINLPNMALLDVSGLYEKDEVKIRDEAIEAWEYVLEKCGELRLSILDFADRFHLQDNYPKENFLQPPFIASLGQNNNQNERQTEKKREEETQIGNTSIINVNVNNIHAAVNVTNVKTYNKNTSVSIQVNKEGCVQPSEKPMATNLDSNVGIVNNEEQESQPTDEQDTPNKSMQKANSRQILKEEELKKYFSLSFKGGGNSATKIDYFTEYLLPDLKVNRTDKDFARIALLIYDSGKLNQSMKPRTFTMWYQTFCCLVGCKYHKHYKRSNLGVDDKFKKSFNYL